MLIYTKQIYHKYARDLKGLTGATVFVIAGSKHVYTHTSNSFAVFICGKVPTTTKMIYMHTEKATSLKKHSTLVPVKSMGIIFQ